MSFTSEVITQEEKIFEMLTLVALAKDCLSKVRFENPQHAEALIRLILRDLENAYQGLHAMYSEVHQNSLRETTLKDLESGEDSGWKFN